MRISGSGAGSIELARTSGHSADPGACLRANFDPRLRTASRPQAGLLGHVGAIPDLIYGEVISSPPRRERLCCRRPDRPAVRVHATWVDFPEGTVLPFWLGNGAEDRREARLSSRKRNGYYSICSFHTRSSPAIRTRTGYTSGRTRWETMRVSTSMRRKLPLFPLTCGLRPTSLRRVNPSTAHGSRTCEEVLCSTVRCPRVAADRNSSFSLHLGALRVI